MPKDSPTSNLKSTNGKTARESFDFWKVTAVSSLAIASVNLGLLYFLTMEIRTLIFADAIVINTHPRRDFVQPVASGSAEPTTTPTPTKSR